jgi:hypothetical protein
LLNDHIPFLLVRFKIIADDNVCGSDLGLTTGSLDFLIQYDNESRDIGWAIDWLRRGYVRLLNYLQAFPDLKDNKKL